MRWMRRRCDRVKINNGKYAERTGTVEANVYRRTVDFPHEFANIHKVMLETEERRISHHTERGVTGITPFDAEPANSNLESRIIGEAI